MADRFVDSGGDDVGPVRTRRGHFRTTFGESGPVRQSHGPQGGSISSFSIALICTTSRWIPASASTNQGPAKDDTRVNLHPTLAPHAPSTNPQRGGQITFFNCVDSYHKPPDSGERQLK